MTLKEMKIQTFSLIEEYYPEETLLAEDEDVQNKINGTVNQIMLDLMKYRKINAKFKTTIEKDDSKEINVKRLIPECYQIKSIVLDNNAEYTLPNDDTILLDNNYIGDLKIYYYKYPELLKLTFETEEESAEYDENYTFELDDILLQIMPYGIAADLLKTDMISNYGTYFYNRYLELKNSIDSRRTGGVISISGGVDI